MIKMIVKHRVMNQVRKLISIAKEKVSCGEDADKWFDYVKEHLDFIWNAKLIGKKNIDILWRELQDATNGKQF